MSDLQCAATLRLVPAGMTAGPGDLSAGTRIAHVWTSDAPEAVEAAQRLAVALGVGVAVRAGLDDPERGPALAEIADEHRGETVLVVVARGDAVTEVAIDDDGWAWR